MDIAIMLEGQNGLNWENFIPLAKAVEDLGFVGLYRSDHFTNGGPPDIDSLEMWTSLTWLATHTSRLEFGPMVSPVSFRDPVMNARMGKDVDDLSGGRLQLGVGAGWQDREHEKFGYDLLDISGRMKRFEEGLQVITLLLNNDEPVNFEGEFYTLKEALLLPRPDRAGGPPITVGGNGRNVTMRLAARYAAIWNAIYLPPNEFSELNEVMDGHMEAEGRDPGDIQRTMMLGLYFGEDDAAVTRRLGDRDRDAYRARGVIIGTPSEVVDQLGEVAEAGCERVMLQWLDLDDLDGLEGFAKAALPHFPSAG